MDINTKNNSLHHAYCLVGDCKKIIPELLKEMNISTSNNPDFLYSEYDVLDIEDSRKLNELHKNRPVGERKIFVVNTNFITEKAQNSLLKMFEEPKGDTHFFLVVPSEENIIATLKSRMEIIRHKSQAKSLLDAKSFLKMSIGKRLEAVKEFLEEIKDEKNDNHPSKAEIVKFINALEMELKKAGSVEKMEKMEKIRQYANMQSPSLKMLLEFVAINT